MIVYKEWRRIMMIMVVIVIMMMKWVSVMIMIMIMIMVMIMIMIIVIGSHNNHNHNLNIVSLVNHPCLNRLIPHLDNNNNHYHSNLYLPFNPLFHKLKQYHHPNQRTITTIWVMTIQLLFTMITIMMILIAISNLNKQKGQLNYYYHHHNSQYYHPLLITYTNQKSKLNS